MLNPITRKARTVKRTGGIVEISPSIRQALTDGASLFGNVSRLANYLDYDSSSIHGIIRGKQKTTHASTMMQLRDFARKLSEGRVRVQEKGVPGHNLGVKKGPNKPRRKPVEAFSPRPAENPEQLAGLTDRMRSQVRAIAIACIEDAKREHAACRGLDREKTIAALQSDLREKERELQKLRAQLENVKFILK